MSTPFAMERVTPALQTYSILAAAVTAGINLGSSIVTIPAVLEAPPSSIARQWETLYYSGITPVVSLAMSSAAGFAVLAFGATQTPTLAVAGDVSHAKRNLYGAAAVAAFGLAPYTRILMGHTNNTLMLRAKVSKDGGKGDEHALVRAWGRWVLGRGLMLLASAGLGLWATVN
ncbi:hypothetical protein EJ04DRAFT_579983 [Polyplosphaeria fusca]|uniref:DUF1772-domain-containing protein n=1 Tax=Polyplosphaeria fusca TaxID=682080 RepID=A0A9P4UYP8_9PLEO|nr:hypothetical protein EJ04DRAFT_579983 [Polyplosphaeria fusca]